MPETALWTLIVGLIVLALGLTYKIADYRQTLKRTNDDLSAARSEISTLNKKYNKQIQDIQISHETRINELTETISNLRNKDKFIKQNGLLWLPNDPEPFCLNCFETRDEEVHMFHFTQLIPRQNLWLCQTCGNKRPAHKNPNP